MCLGEWRRLIIILFAYWEVASIIFLGLHDKLQIAKVIYAKLNLFCERVGVWACVLVCEHLHVLQNEVNMILFLLSFVCDHGDGCQSPRAGGGTIPLFHSRLPGETKTWNLGRRTQISS